MRIVKIVFLLLTFFLSAQTGFSITLTNKKPGELELQIKAETKRIEKEFSAKSEKKIKLKGYLTKEDVHFIAKYAKENDIAFLDFSKCKFKEIGLGLFEGCKGLKKIKFSKNLNTIAKQAFKNCTSIESLTLPKSLTSIGSEAFYMCNNLKSLSFHKKVSWIGKDAFKGCELQKIKTHGNREFISDKNRIFSKSGDKIY